MMLKRLSPDSEVEVLVLTDRERETITRALTVVVDLETIGYPGARDAMVWLRGVLNDAEKSS